MDDDYVYIAQTMAQITKRVVAQLGGLAEPKTSRCKINQLFKNIKLRSSAMWHASLGMIPNVSRNVFLLSSRVQGFSLTLTTADDDRLLRNVGYNWPNDAATWESPMQKSKLAHYRKVYMASELNEFVGTNQEEIRCIGTTLILLLRKGTSGGPAVLGKGANTHVPTSP